MASDSKREELMAEIERLQQQSQKFLAEGRFGGWTNEEEQAHRKRSDRIKRLRNELDALDEKK